MVTIRHAYINGTQCWVVFHGPQPVAQFDFLTQAQIFALTNYGAFEVQA
jgi:hypothetical protein